MTKKECGGGKLTFHIDAHGRLQLCSNNRRAGYDLRTGGFQRGFYEVLPTFPCPARAVADAEPLSIQITRRPDRTGRVGRDGNSDAGASRA